MFTLPRRTALLAAALAAFASPAAAVDTDFLFSFGSPGTGNGQFNSPTEITIGPSGAVYVLDAGNARIQKFDAEGNYLAQWISARPFQGAMNSLGATPDGSVYVQSTYYITRYDADGNYQSWWGPLGGSSSGSHHVTTGRDGLIYLKYWANGFYYVSRWSGPVQPAGGFSSGSIAIGPVAADAAGNVFFYGVDQITNAELMYKRTSAGAAISDWPSARVSGLTCDAQGNVYACEGWQNDRVRVYDNAGSELAVFGVTGSGPGEFRRPWDAAVGADGRIYVVDRDNNRIQVFGNGSTPAHATSWGGLKRRYR